MVNCMVDCSLVRSRFTGCSKPDVGGLSLSDVELHTVGFG